MLFCSGERGTMMGRDSSEASAVITKPIDAAVNGEGAAKDRATARGITPETTPQEFYAEMVARADIRAILAELAQN